MLSSRGDHEKDPDSCNQKTDEASAFPPRPNIHLLVNSTTFPSHYVSMILFFLLVNRSWAFCDELSSNPTWKDLTTALTDATPSGLAILCPFTIQGSGCPNPQDMPYTQGEGTRLYVLCGDFGRITPAACVIDCPYQQWNVPGGAEMTLEGFSLLGGAASRFSASAANPARINVIDPPLLDLYGIWTMFGGTLAQHHRRTTSLLSSHKNSKLFLEGTVVCDNKANGTILRAEGNVSIRSSTLHQNHVTVLTVGPSGEVTIAESVFSENRSTKNGGAIAVVTSTFTQEERITQQVSITESQFLGNRAGARGGAIFDDNDSASSHVSIHRSTFNGNQAAIVGPAVYSSGQLIEFSGNTGCVNFGKQGSCNGVNYADGSCDLVSNECTLAPVNSAPSGAPSARTTSPNLDLTVPSTEVPTRSPIDTNSPTRNAKSLERTPGITTTESTPKLRGSSSSPTSSTRASSTSTPLVSSSPIASQAPPQAPSVTFQPTSSTRPSSRLSGSVVPTTSLQPTLSQKPTSDPSSGYSVGPTVRPIHGRTQGRTDS